MASRDEYTHDDYLREKYCGGINITFVPDQYCTIGNYPEEKAKEDGNENEE